MLESDNRFRAYRNRFYVRDDFQNIHTAFLFLLPGSRFAEATPSIRVWEYVLIVSVLHVSVLAMLVDRWLAARGKVVAAWAEEASRPASGGALARMFRPRAANRRNDSPVDHRPAEDEPEISEGPD